MENVRRVILKRIGASFFRGIVPGLLLVLTACRATPPGRFERAVVAQVKRNITIGGRLVPDPLPATEETIAKGLDLFSRHCIACHGLDGQNTGVPFADSMSPPIPLLPSHEIQKYKDGQLKWIIENGIFPSGMPAWKGILDDEEMWAIVHYLRHLPPKGSLGVPTFYEGIRSNAATTSSPKAMRTSR
jgi:mono/diheme cytochrome c family protein